MVVHRLEILRVVIDTNLIISAILNGTGASAKLIDWMEDEDYFRLLISQPIWDEYTTVANWLIPDSKQLEKKRVLKTLRDQSDWIEPDFQLSVCSDISDNRFLECAVVGNADYLVTKNIRHFPHKKYENIRILKISQFLTVLEKIEKS
jgi:putative PIN family toxin of toxin-antitoxin system